MLGIGEQRLCHGGCAVEVVHMWCIGAITVCVCVCV